MDILNAEYAKFKISFGFYIYCFEGTLDAIELSLYLPGNSRYQRVKLIDISPEPSSIENKDQVIEVHYDSYNFTDNPVIFKAELEIISNAKKEDMSNIPFPIIQKYLPEINNYLIPSFEVESENEQLINESKKLTQNCKNLEEAITRIAEYVNRNILYAEIYGGKKRTAYDTYVLKTGVCYEKANLFAALCRAVNIPCRLVSGFSGNFEFVDGKIVDDWGGHAWAEIYTRKKWVPVDPTYTPPEIGFVDPGHISVFFEPSLNDNFYSYELEGNAKISVDYKLKLESVDIIKPREGKKIQPLPSRPKLEQKNKKTYQPLPDAEYLIFSFPFGLVEGKKLFSTWSLDESLVLAMQALNYEKIKYSKIAPLFIPMAFYLSEKEIIPISISQLFESNTMSFSYRQVRNLDKVGEKISEIYDFPALEKFERELELDIIEKNITINVILRHFVQDLENFLPFIRIYEYVNFEEYDGLIEPKIYSAEKMDSLVKKDIGDILKGDIVGSERLISYFQMFVETADEIFEKLYENYNREVAVLKNVISQNQRILEKINTEVSKLKKSISQNRNNRERIKNKVEEIENEIKKTNLRIKDAKNNIEQIRIQLRNITYNDLRNELREKLVQFENEVNRLNRMKTGYSKLQIEQLKKIKEFEEEILSQENQLRGLLKKQQEVMRILEKNEEKNKRFVKDYQNKVELIESIKISVREKMIMDVSDEQQIARRYAIDSSLSPLKNYETTKRIALGYIPCFISIKNDNLSTLRLTLPTKFALKNQRLYVQEKIYLQTYFDELFKKQKSRNSFIKTIIKFLTRNRNLDKNTGTNIEERLLKDFLELINNRNLLSEDNKYLLLSGQKKLSFRSGLKKIKWIS
ncbi:MAG: hypothetical protein K9W46_04475 [Candidatus Heimdallarchaeum endolithica]|uniref:Transglutaminase-like domain-containing protein n=1 Tax=Candidatus Heimdallarchaeum endolithica TaxID=2876572 RepID=A0A9Y1BSQ6_9ARCH|nr:MAG: hypothetical protein K9W46_04475 [Candidatus Heimdallarchaeum endolithica]